MSGRLLYGHIESAGVTVQMYYSGAGQLVLASHENGGASRIWGKVSMGIVRLCGYWWSMPISSCSVIALEGERIPGKWI